MGATGLDALVGAATEGMRKTKSAEEMSEGGEGARSRGRGERAPLGLRRRPDEGEEEGCVPQTNRGDRRQNESTFGGRRARPGRAPRTLRPRDELTPRSSRVSPRQASRGPRTSTGSSSSACRSSARCEAGKDFPPHVRRGATAVFIPPAGARARAAPATAPRPRASPEAYRARFKPPIRRARAGRGHGLARGPSAPPFPGTWHRAACSLRRVSRFPPARHIARREIATTTRFKREAKKRFARRRDPLTRAPRPRPPLFLPSRVTGAASPATSCSRARPRRWRRTRRSTSSARTT